MKPNHLLSSDQFTDSKQLEQIMYPAKKMEEQMLSGNTEKRFRSLIFFDFPTKNFPASKHFNITNHFRRLPIFLN